MDNLLSYTRILDDIKQFRRSGTKHGRDFNVLDMPSHKYFKILFYFGSSPEFGNDCNICDEYATYHGNSDNFGSGLLAPTWEIRNNIKTDEDNADISKNSGFSISTLKNVLKSLKINTTSEIKDFYNYNSAWAYLMLNDEIERAEKLEQFVTLLSDISSNSPWCFESVTGIGEALERKVVDDGKLDMATPKSISIVCKPDSFDNRIGTLLSLYRDVVWSWIHKRQVIPVNLRKFDMAIYMFESPVNGWNVDSIIDSNSDDKFRPSYKMVEFHNCEFKYNSIKSGFGDINNTTGFASKYTIEITYDDAYEIAYNDIMMRRIGDVILTDLINNSKNSDAYNSVSQQDNEAQRTFLNAKNIYGENNPSFMESAIDQLAGHAAGMVNSVFNRAILGNLYSLSLSKIDTQIEEALQPNIIKTGMTAAQYIKNIKKTLDNKADKTPEGNIFEGSPKKETKESEGNIFEGSPKKETKESEGNIFKDAVISSTPTKLGNIFKNSTIANN